jgi:hypothetical protein
MRYAAFASSPSHVDGLRRPPVHPGTLNHKARDNLRRVLIRDHADRDALSSRLMRHRDER